MLLIIKQPELFVAEGLTFARERGTPVIEMDMEKMEVLLQRFSTITIHRLLADKIFPWADGELIL
jgi:hypothetical protein